MFNSYNYVSHELSQNKQLIVNHNMDNNNESEDQSVCLSESDDFQEKYFILSIDNVNEEHNYYSNKQIQNNGIFHKNQLIFNVFQFLLI